MISIEYGEIPDFTGCGKIDFPIWDDIKWVYYTDDENWNSEVDSWMCDLRDAIVYHNHINGYVISPFILVPDEVMPSDNF